MPLDDFGNCISVFMRILFCHLICPACIKTGERSLVRVDEVNHFIFRVAF